MASWEVMATLEGGSGELLPSRSSDGECEGLMQTFHWGEPIDFGCPLGF